MAALAGETHRSGHHIECSNGDMVAWCAGHVLEMAPPGDYAAELETWALDTLREGQLLVDEVLQFLGWKGPTERLLVTDLSPVAVQRALGALEPNERFRPLYEAALARQRADWLYGLNLTRLYTLRARLGGYQGVLSVGRVQTPLLGLIVRRDREIECFVSKPFYGVDATLRTADGAEFRGHWAVGKEHEASRDSEGRLLSRPVADAVRRKSRGSQRWWRLTIRSRKPRPRRFRTRSPTCRSTPDASSA